MIKSLAFSDKNYLVTVVNSFGEVVRRSILGSQIDDLLGSDPVALQIREYELVGRLVECLVVDDYDIFSNRKVADHFTIIEVITSRLKLYIFGAGHVGKALAVLASLVGYVVIVFDDRDEFLLSIEEIGVKGLKVDFNCLDVELDSNSVIVIVTRGHQFDELCLRYVSQFNNKYVGMIGSRRRVLGVLRRLQGLVSEEVISSVHAPIGLRIGATTPMEIAISIIAEIISVANK